MFVSFSDCEMNALSSVLVSVLFLLNALTDTNGFLIGRIRPSTDDAEFATYRLR